MNFSRLNGEYMRKICLCVTNPQEIFKMLKVHNKQNLCSYICKSPNVYDFHLTAETLDDALFIIDFVNKELKYSVDNIIGWKQLVSFSRSE